MEFYNQEEASRFKKWVDLSIKFGNKELPNLTLYIQDLGRIDIGLLRRDKKITSTIHTKKTPQQELEFGFYLQETQALSRLWVFQSYEIVRILKNRSGEDDRLQSLYKILRRIRIPLAKLEAADGYNTDQNVGQLIVDRKNGIAWATNEDFIISRQELSNMLLSII